MGVGEIHLHVEQAAALASSQKALRKVVAEGHHCGEHR